MIETSVVTGTGSYLPSKVLETSEFPEQLRVPERVAAKIGVNKRRQSYSPQGFECRDEDMGYLAAMLALEAAELEPKYLNRIVVISATPTRLFTPLKEEAAISLAGAVDQEEFDSLGLNDGYGSSPAHILASRLGVSRDCWASYHFEGCGSLVWGLDEVHRMREIFRRTLIVASNTSSSFFYSINPASLDENDRLNANIFGDGAAALVVQTWPVVDGMERGIVSSQGDFDFSDSPVSTTVVDHWNPNESYPGQFKFHVEHRKVLKSAPAYMQGTMERILSESGFTLKDVDHFIVHQASMATLEALLKLARIPREKVPINVDKYGNTSAASTGIILDEGIRSGRIKKGDLAMVLGAGGGFPGWQYGGVLLRV
ncbi:hypothetical protein HYV84_02505 [Candidatus Woesearchaeota archaeon]|nr:hypothetical protein [Candidatus Woesearchaeota archaeon]